MPRNSNVQIRRAQERIHPLVRGVGTVLGLFALLLLLPTCVHVPAGSSVEWNAQLRDELLEMFAADQSARRSDDVDLAKMAVIDKANTARLKQIVASHGWPTVSMVGFDGARAAWALAQHADADRELQRQVLGMMEPLVGRNEVIPADYALLYDRVHSPQRFGSQGRCVSKGVWVPREIENPASVDIRREAVGLEPLQTYISQVSTHCTH